MEPNLNGGVAAFNSHQNNVTSIERIVVMVSFGTGKSRLRLWTQMLQGIGQLLGCYNWLVQPSCKAEVFEVVAVLGHKLQHQGFLGAPHANVIMREPLDTFVLPFVHETRQQPELVVHVWQMRCHVELVRPVFAAVALLVQLQMLHDN